MKKKAILGFMTGAAIVAATTGSYAAWDKLSDTSTTTLNIEKPITISPTTDLAFDETAVNGTNSKLYEATNPSYEASVTFTPVISRSYNQGVNPLVSLEVILAGILDSFSYHPIHNLPYASVFAHWQPICATHAITCLKVILLSSGRFWIMKSSLSNLVDCSVTPQTSQASWMICNLVAG